MCATGKILRVLRFIPLYIYVLTSISGCATYSLHDSIQHAPRADAKRYPVLHKGRYLGQVNSSGIDYYIYDFANIIWKAPVGGIGFYVLVPRDEEDGEATIMSTSISPDHILACQGSSAENARRIFSREVLSQKKHLLNLPVYAYFTTNENEFSDGRSFEQIPMDQIRTDYPLVLGVVMANSKHTKGLRTAQVTNPGQSPTVWKWSGPRELRECLVPPTGGEKTLSQIGFLGYLVTVPVDILTSPFQLIFFGVAYIALKDGGLHY